MTDRLPHLTHQLIKHSTNRRLTDCPYLYLYLHNLRYSHSLPRWLSHRPTDYPTNQLRLPDLNDLHRSTHKSICHPIDQKSELHRPRPGQPADWPTDRWKDQPADWPSYRPTDRLDCVTWVIYTKSTTTDQPSIQLSIWRPSDWPTIVIIGCVTWVISFYPIDQLSDLPSDWPIIFVCDPSDPHWLKRRLAHLQTDHPVRLTSYWLTDRPTKWPSNPLADHHFGSGVCDLSDLQKAQFLSDLIFSYLPRHRLSIEGLHKKTEERPQTSRRARSLSPRRHHLGSPPATPDRQLKPTNGRYNVNVVSDLKRAFRWP